MKKIFGCLVAGVLLAGCSKDGTGSAPQAETEVKINVDDTKDSVKKAFDKAGKKIESGAKEAKEKLEDAGDKIKDKYEEAKDNLKDDKKAEVKVEVKKD